MTNPMFNPQPNYSGVTIQIANPAVNVGQQVPNSRYFYPGQTYSTNQNAYISTPNGVVLSDSKLTNYQGIDLNSGMQGNISAMVPANQTNDNVNNRFMASDSPYNNQPQPNGFYNAYPPQYYLNNYNYQNNPAGLQNSDAKVNENNSNSDDAASMSKEELVSALQKITQQENSNSKITENLNDFASVKNSEQNNRAENISVNHENQEEKQINEKPVYESNLEEEDLTKSHDIIEDLNARQTAIEEEKKNEKQKKVIALTDEYIKSLENYLNNPNDEIRLMASKEILTRLDEDKDRYNDAALNALLNKMLQDPSKLIRIAALSAFSSQLASGNNYTITLLQNIQQNPSADKEDVIQAADILLKMSAGTEVKNIPNPSVKENVKQS